MQSHKMTKRRESPLGRWDVGTGYPTALFLFFTSFYDEYGVPLSPLNLDLRAYNGAPRHYSKVGVHQMVLRPP